MKKLLALLLALMLPVAALAETFQVNLETKTDDVLFTGYVTELLQMIPGLLTTDAEKYATAISTLLRDASVSVVAQDDAVSMDIALSGSSLFDVTIRQTETASYMTSSLLPGYALAEQLNGTDASVKPDNDDLERIANGMKEAVSAWLADIVPSTTKGVFEGDAYTGGTQCTTWMLTDQDIAALLSRVMTADLRALCTRMLTSGDVSAADLLKLFDAANDRVADEDKFAYILRVVKNDAGQFVGLSLSVFEEAAQPASISFGMTEQDARLVIGLGLNSRNYWWEADLRRSQKNQVTYLKGGMREWVADKSQSFAYVSKTNAPVTSTVWTCNLTKSGQRTLWDGCVYEGSEINAEYVICSFSGSVNPSMRSLETRGRLLREGHNALEVSLTCKPAAAIKPLDDNVKICVAGDPVQEKLYTELNQKFNFAVTARMLQLIPLDVILTLGELFAE